jgi:hypothetical protein
MGHLQTLSNWMSCYQDNQLNSKRHKILSQINYLNNSWSNCLVLADDPLAIKLIYLHLKFQTNSYYIL